MASWALLFRFWTTYVKDRFSHFWPLRLFNIMDFCALCLPMPMFLAPSQRPPAVAWLVSCGRGGQLRRIISSSSLGHLLADFRGLFCPLCTWKFTASIQSLWFSSILGSVTQFGVQVVFSWLFPSIFVHISSIRVRLAALICGVLWVLIATAFVPRIHTFDAYGQVCAGPGQLGSHILLPPFAARFVNLSCCCFNFCH